MEKQPRSMDIPPSNPEPAETFEIEFINARAPEVTQAMSRIGGFGFRTGKAEDDGTVVFEGGRSDGTTIKIIIEKGDAYKSPAEIAAEEQE